MTRDEILAAFDRIRVWQQGDRRAVHKPLLVLLALGRLLRGESPLVEFAGIEDQLGKLLEEFGPSGSEKTRHNPFWHLRTDGVWQLAGPAGITSRPAGATPTIVCFIGGRKPPDASDCWASRSATTSLGMQLQAQSPDDLEDGIEARATLAGKRFIQALAGQPGISRNL